ncbi:hypothetical protein A605_00965 [Corynebacterium halotolerans YIM 70093 = DSM 44683]|uniref:N-acetyltransferase domain-containing protein n=2 Tax=Corynebacterium halotolerans TaxID=225326 RepID=M1MU22_9CORY|nr:hypothetical protein A605_00965 [Corynebacterium halotolerans YIM 70093 = DSM 44683]
MLGRMDSPTWPLPVTVLEGGRIRLRPLREADADNLVATSTDPDTIRYSPLPDEYTRDTALDYIRGAQDASRAMIWAIELLDEPDSLAGVIELRGVYPHAGYVDVGYRTAPWARGRGAAKEALLLATRHAFTHGCHRVELLAAVDNIASRRVAERCGFQFEGIARDREYLHGAYRDLAMYSLLSTDGDGDGAGE